MLGTTLASLRVAMTATSCAGMLVDVPLGQCGFADAGRAIEVDQARHGRNLLCRRPHVGALEILRHVAYPRLAAPLGPGRKLR
jgi:hypothetical protein